MKWLAYREVIVWVVVLAAAIILGFPEVIPNAYGAEPACPEWATPDEPIVRQSYRGRDRDGKPWGLGPRLDTPSYYWKMGTWFKMPLGYHNPWAKQEYGFTLIDRDRYKELLGRLVYKGYDPKTGKYNPDLVTRGGIDGQFAFWMPSRRYVERDRWTTPAFRPCEAGRQKPKQSEYVVHIQIKWPFLPGAEQSEMTVQFRNAFDDLANTGRVRMQNMRSFEHSRNGPISGTKRFNIYHDDGDTVVMLRGTPFTNNDGRWNPVCDGRIWQRSSDLVLQIALAGDQCQVGDEARWREPVFAAIKLAKRWRYDGHE